MKIGPIQLTSPFCQAGLAGYSDRAMRLVARRRGCAYAVTEALLDTILLSGGMGLKKSIDINDEDHPIAGQIIGSEPEQMAAAAVILATHGYDVIDLNYACPVKKIRNRARGGHMLRDVPRALAILRQVRDALPPHVPTTISLRRGFDDSPASVDAFHEIVEAAWAHGYSAVRVHARTVEQKYLGRSTWPFLRDLKQRYPDRTILGSGDIFTAGDAVRMKLETGVDIVWIARGAIGNPWIFSQVRALADGLPLPEPPRLLQQRRVIEEHYRLAEAIYGPETCGRQMRKFGIKYSRLHPTPIEVRNAFIAVRRPEGLQQVLDTFYAEDLPGRHPEVDAAEDSECEST